jgi:uncharacterized protein YjbI with pentapeptide repeats
LEGANLSDANLRSVNLSSADLSGAIGLVREQWEQVLRQAR